MGIRFREGMGRVDLQYVRIDRELERKVKVDYKIKVGH